MLEPKIMNVYYGTDLLPYKDKERSVHYPITSGSVFTGASNSTEIRFYVDQIGDLDLTWVANAKLPNGKTGSKVLTGGTDENGTYVSLSLSSWYTQLIGDLYIGLQGYNGGINYSFSVETGLYEIYGTPTIQATGIIKLHISYSTPFNGESDVLETDIQEFLAFATEIMTKQITVVEDISLADISSYANGHIFYDKETNQFYSKTSTSPYYTIYKLIPVIEITNATTSLSLDEVLALESFPSYIIKNGMLYVHSGTDQSEMYFDRLDGYGTYITDNGNCTMYFPTIVVKNSHAPVGEVGDITIIERDATWYTKQQIDNELTNFVTLSTDQTITGNKSFSGHLDIYGPSFVVDSPTTFEDRVDIYADTYLHDGVEITTRTNNQINRGFGLYMQGDNELVLYETVDSSVLMKYYFYHDQVEPNELYIGVTTGDTDVYVSGRFDALSVISNEYKLGRYKLQYNINSGTPTTFSLVAAEVVDGNNVDKEWIRFTHYPTAVGNDDEIEIGTPSGNETIVSVNGEVNADKLIANDLRSTTIRHPTSTSNTITINSPITVQAPTTNSNPTTKQYVDNLVATVKANTFKVVASLPASGEEGIIYLVAISGSSAYRQYIWESNQYIYLGDTSISLEDYVNLTSDQVVGGFKTFEDTLKLGSQDGGAGLLSLYNASTDSYQNVLQGGTSGGDFEYPSFLTNVGFAEDVNFLGNIELHSSNVIIVDSGDWAITLPQASGELVVSSQLLADDTDIANILGD